MDPRCWNETEKYAEEFMLTDNSPYFLNMYRAVLNVNGLVYPCWIGPKTANGGRFAGILLILPRDQQIPESQNRSHSCCHPAGDDFQFVTFRNAPDADRPNEGYGEMRAYFGGNISLSLRDNTGNEIAPLGDVMPGQIVARLQNPNN